MQTIPAFRRPAFPGPTASTVRLAALGQAVGGLNDPGAAGEPASRPTTKAEALTLLVTEMEDQRNRFMSVFRVDGQFLNLLVKATRARSVLELGTSQGYSALWLALALEESGGHLTTVDQRPERIELARQNLGRAGLLHRVTFRDGDAHHLLALIDGPFDFVFLDADKGGNFDYFQKLYPKKLLAGGLLVARKAISMRDAMKQYLQALEQHPAFDAVILNLPTGDNFSVAYRKRK